ncbi:MAG: hypothetical protein K2M08_00485 [Anaeroplasmataceae bacterium]|nr:hypothetical protein [Anaeroplasmataceae bacterium]
MDSVIENDKYKCTIKFDYAFLFEREIKMRKREKRHIIETSKEIPLVRGKREWNFYDIDNSILHNSDHKGTHPSLVLVEYKGRVLVAEVTHSRGNMKLPIVNPNTQDIEQSFIKRKTKVTRNKENTRPITLKDLRSKRNDRFLSEEEKIAILASLNNKKINKINMRVLVELKEKKKPKK